MNWESPIVYIAGVGVILSIAGFLITAGVALFKTGKWVEGINALRPTVEKTEETVHGTREDVQSLLARYQADSVKGQNLLSLTEESKKNTLGT